MSTKKPLKNVGMQNSKKINFDFVNHLLYVFDAPIITIPGYKDITKNMTERVHLYRLLETKEIENKMATDYEVMLYTHSASFGSPLSHSWFKIYLNTFSKYHEVKPILEDNLLEDLDDNELEQLQDLKSWIYKKQTEHLKQKYSSKNF